MVSSNFELQAAIIGLTKYRLSIFYMFLIANWETVTNINPGQSKTPTWNCVLEWAFWVVGSTDNNFMIIFNHCS